jgi:hypothetical protein
LEVSNKDYLIKIGEEIRLNRRKTMKLDFIRNIVAKYNLLSVDERKLFYYTYIDKTISNKTNTDKSIYCGYTESHYYRLRKTICLKIAILLDIEEYEEVSKTDDEMEGEKASETSSKI